MIFIWGSRYRTSTRGTGRFYCPQCGELDVGYRHQAARPWFTMYFIPVFPIGGIEEHIECVRCAGTFKLEVLDLEPPTADDFFLRDCYKRLTRGRSLERIEADLVDSGRPSEVAVEMIDAMTEGKVRECERCGAHYLKSVKKCRACDGRRELTGGSAQL